MIDFLLEEQQKEYSYKIAKYLKWYIDIDIIDGVIIYDKYGNKIYRASTNNYLCWLEYNRLLGNIEKIDPLEYFIINLYNVKNIKVTWKILNEVSKQFNLDDISNSVYDLSITVFIEKSLDRVLELIEEKDKQHVWS